MQFLIIGRDGTDSEAGARRQAARQAHLAAAEALKKEGKLLMAAALLDEEGKMTGSVMIFNFDSREDLDDYLSEEPYVKAKVWKEIEQRSVAVPGLFMPASGP